MRFASAMTTYANMCARACYKYAARDGAPRAGGPGVPVDWRDGGTNRSFGVSLKLLEEARAAALELQRGTVGDNVMYFETGQGSALSAGAHEGVDQQTCEARAYAVARHLKPLLVNTVVGFIGPEYLLDGKQIIRAGLEDHFCGKLLGLPMGAMCATRITRKRTGRYGYAADAAGGGRGELRDGRAGRR